MTAAIYYHPEAYSTSGPKLMGRHAAGESFLRGFLKYYATDRYWLQVQQADHASHFVKIAQSLGRTHPTQAVTLNDLQQLSNAGLVYFPGPSIGEHAYHRAFFGHQQWSLCGITHTTSSSAAMDGITSLITSPVFSWDALICTSHAVKKNVMALIDLETAFLKERLGMTKSTLPQLPVIPLGIHTEDFHFTSQDRIESCAELSIEEDAVVVLYMGRLSFHAKAHPLAMYQALEMAHKKTQKKLVLIECGWHANDFIKDAYRDAAQTQAPSVKVITLDGRDPHHRKLAWSSAAIFCSLSDNLQETFGIVPIEAMAAGIPVVVSDWDGYKDTVREGIDGFKVPTIMPKEGLGGDLALRHALGTDTYDMYCGHTCSLIAVDVMAAAAALTQLIVSPALRDEMGTHGKKRAQSLYDWSAIIPQYVALWTELDQIRQKDGRHLKKSLASPWPARADPFTTFAHYASHQLHAHSRLALVDKSVEIALRRVKDYQDLAMVNFAKYIIPSEIEWTAVLRSASLNPQPAIDLVKHIPEERKAFVFRALTWLIKLGVLRLTP